MSRRTPGWNPKRYGRFPSCIGTGVRYQFFLSAHRTLGQALLVFET